MPDKRIALITGANKGIGFEIARGLIQQGVITYIGSRDRSRGEQAVQALLEEYKDAQVYSIEIDVTNPDTTQTAANQIEKQFGYLDILVNNAGIIDPKDASPLQTDLGAVRQTFETNFFGVISVCQAFVPLLKKSESAKIINMSSGLGSLALNQDPTWLYYPTKLIGYNASKAALNMLTIQLEWELKDTKITVNAVNPNFTDTDLVPSAEGGRPVKDGAKAAIKLALTKKNAINGQFIEDNETLPW